MFGIGALIGGLGTALSAGGKIGGAIAAKRKLNRAQSPESAYAQRYNQTFENALNANQAAQMQTANQANTAQGQVAGQRAALANTVNSGSAAARAASQDAANYAQQVQQDTQNQVKAAQGVGNAVGWLGEGAAHFGGVIQNRQDMQNAADLQQERDDQFFRAWQENQARNRAQAELMNPWGDAGQQRAVQSVGSWGGPEQSQAYQNVMAPYYQRSEQQAQLDQEAAAAMNEIDSWGGPQNSIYGNVGINTAPGATVKR